MIIYEVEQMIEVDTPKGHGRIWMVTDYGSEIEKLYLVITDDGELWDFPPQKLKVADNVTMGRGKWKVKGE